MAAVVEVSVTFTENFSPGCAGKPPKRHLIKSVVKELKNTPTSTSKYYKQKFVFQVFAALHAFTFSAEVFSTRAEDVVIASRKAFGQTNTSAGFLGNSHTHSVGMRKR